MNLQVQMKPTRPQKTRGGYKNLRLCLFTFQLMFLQLLSSLFEKFFPQVFCILFRCQLGRCYKLETRALESNPILTQFRICNMYSPSTFKLWYSIVVQDFGMTKAQFPSLATEDKRSTRIFTLYWQTSRGRMANFPALIVIALKSFDL